MTSLSKETSLFNESRCRWWLIALLTLPATSFAATLNGQLIGDQLRWSNGMERGGDMVVLTNWTPMNGLQPTQEWTPGTFIGTPPPTLTLSQGADSVDVPIKVAGVEYGLGQASSVFTQTGSPIPGYTTCGESTQTPSVATLIGSNCVASQSYLSETKTYTPFQFVRPILEVDEAVLIANFRERSLPSGQYTGTVYVRPVYAFRSPTGSWTYRNALSVPITVSIRYEAANLQDIRIIGDGVIDPQYDTTNHQVSGETFFRIIANGFFTEGLKMTIEPGEDGKYELEHTNASLGRVIPYSISCDACEDKNIVVDGNAQLSDGMTHIPGEGNNITYSLRVHYDKVTADSIDTGDYNDSFVAYFEENL